MNKLFLALFGIVGVVATNGSSNANGTGSTVGPSTADPGPTAEEDATTASENNVANFTMSTLPTGTKAVFSMSAVVTLSSALPANVTAADITALDLTATPATSSSTGAGEVVYKIQDSLQTTARAVDDAAVVVVTDVASGARRSLAERRRLSVALKVYSTVEGSSLANAKALKSASQKADFATSFAANMATAGYTAQTATPTVSAAICQASGCSDIEGEDLPATTTTTSDAIKTTMGVAVALVSGLFLF